LQEEDNSVYYFSDEFQPLLPSEGPTRYARDDVFRDEMKKLRRGDYTPDLLLDVHGLTQLQTKRELAALIVACRREQIHCACIMHGHGKHILKQRIPLWLAQHPDVVAFHQAAQKWGGAAALLVLIELAG
jgi:DNA-nicking Smr family endonuclease